MLGVTEEKYTVEVFRGNGCICSISVSAKSYEEAVDEALSNSNVISDLTDYFREESQPTYGWNLACGVEGPFGRKVICKKFSR